MQTILSPSNIEIRTNQDGTASLYGHAAVFYDQNRADETTYDMGGVEERIMPGAFDKSLASGEDIVALVNHDSKEVVGRRSAGTLHLNSDPKGLAFDLSLNESPRSAQLIADVRSGNMGGCSFGFRVREDGAEWEKDVRNLTDVELKEVSVVTFPAYTGTSVGLRALGDDSIGFDLDLWKARQRRAVALRIDPAA
jgi:HK97 family phage prohead protease